jgi:hypothetical protein
VIGRADSKGQSAYLSFEALNRLMQNMGGEVFDYDSFKAQYDDPKSGLKAMVDKFDGKGITLKTDTTTGGAEGDTDKGDKAVEKMAKRATAKAQGESIEEDAEDDQMKSDLLGFIGSKMQGVEQQLQNAPVNSQEEKENKEFALKMFKFLQSKLEQQKAKNPQ